MAEMHEEPGTELELGGLTFGISFRAPAGATLRVCAPVDGVETEVLRFDDFVDQPHYHVPAAGPSTMFDRDTLGVPLDWFIAQIRDHLGDMLTEGGFAALVPALDLDAVTEHVGDIQKAMEDCVPEGFARVPGVGLTRA